MILDKLENLDIYFDSVPYLREFARFFNDNDLETLPACKIKVIGDDLFVNILDFEGKEEKDCRMEAHQEYIDVQIPLTDSERMGWRAQEDCQEITTPYNEQKDVEFYADKAATFVDVPAGHFAIFFPTDAHQPGIAPDKKYRKIIAKIRCNN